MKRRKVFLSILTVIVLICLIMPLQALADPIPEERRLPRLVDNAELLTEAESEELLEQLDEISEEREIDVAVVTVQSLEGKGVQAYADDFYDYNGYGMGKNDDGILLLVSMSEREWAMTTCGKAVDVFSDWDLEKIGSSFSGDLSSGRYLSGFMKYADLCEKEIEDYDAAHRFPYFKYIGGALVIGLGLSLITVSYMKRQLKTVRPQRAAANYVTPNSLHVTNSQELFLYRTVNRQEKPKESEFRSSGRSSSGSTHRSSSGRSHGGSRGRF